jgi:hypothetical protein
VPENPGAILDQQLARDVVGARQQLGADEPPVGPEALVELGLGERLEVVEALLRECPVDVAAGVEDPALGVAEGAGL